MAAEEFARTGFDMIGAGQQSQSRLARSVTGTIKHTFALLERRQDLLAQLSAREFEILRLLLDGASAEEIGARLSVSTKTVQNCHYQIKVKLGVRSDIELTRIALRLGLICAT